MNEPSKLCGVILAGGKSARMGQPKEWLEWNGKPLIRHMAELFLHAGVPVLVVSNAPASAEALSDLDVRVTPDLVPSHGPMSGICTAMRVTSAEGLLIAACDMPLLTRSDIGLLAQQQEQLKDWDAVVTVAQGRLQPLLALYHRRTRDVWERALQHGDYRLRSVLKQLRYTTLPEHLLSADAAFNMNTPLDYQQARRK